MAMILMAVMGASGHFVRANAAEGSPSPTSSALKAIPPSWEVMPIPRRAEYGAAADFLTLGRVAIVRRAGSPYQTRRDAQGELAGGSTIMEEELTALLKEHGAAQVVSLTDDLPSYEGYDTLILLGAPRHNALSGKQFDALKLSFARWDDPRTPEKDFSGWPDFGREGYLLKAGRLGNQNVILLAGYDYDDAKKQFYGAGTFYAMQSLRQLMVKQRGVAKVKTAEIADKPLVAHRACMTGSPSSKQQNRRDVAMIPIMKANANNYWYGHAVAEYCVEASVKFRYPWRPEQLKFFGEIGKFCREHFVTMVFCLNPDHYGVDWAAPKTFDGKKKDPLHYDPNYQVEPQFKALWTQTGYDVKNDIDIVAAKFAQLNKACGGGAMLTMMNEDDGFGLIHEADIKLFNTATGDPKNNAVNYGKARAQMLVALYRRIRKECPDSSDYLPLILPGQLGYQLVLDRNEACSREFLSSLAATLKELGLLEHMPLITTGGGAGAEVVTNQTIDLFRGWAGGALVSLHDNNFSAHLGAYETDPRGPRSLHQINKELPAGYRDRDLYKRLWGIVWNGLDDHHVLALCQAQYMWNMLALDREKVNALAARKVSSAASYPLVKAFCEEFDGPAGYWPGNHPPYNALVLSNRFAFPSKDWTYVIQYTDAMRQQGQKLRDKLGRLLPELNAKWEDTFEREASLKLFGYPSYVFSTIYLANGYVKGWENDSPRGKLAGASLQELFLDADDLQQRFFFGPERVAGRMPVEHGVGWTYPMNLYTDGGNGKIPKTPAEAKVYIDFWGKGLQGRFFQPVRSIAPADLKDSDTLLKSGWGKVMETDKEKYREVAGAAVLGLSEPAQGRLLIRVRIGTGQTDLTKAVGITLATARAQRQEAVCRPRWVTWLLPEGTDISALKITPEAPVRVYAIEIFRSKTAPDR